MRGVRREFFSSEMFMCGGTVILLFPLVARCCCVCLESFADIECYRDCSCRGSHLLNLFATVLFSVGSAVTVECCVCNSAAWLCL